MANSDSGDSVTDRIVRVLETFTPTRTVQTAAPLAARLDLEPVVVPELREVKLGDWEGGEFRIRAIDGDPIAMRVLSEEPLPLRQPAAGPPLPGRLGPVLCRALARDPRTRYPDVLAFRDALARAL